MSTIDERVVQMKFQSAEFQQGVQQTIRSLEALNKSLQLQGAQKGLAGVAQVSQSFNQNMATNRDALGRFTKGVSEVATETQQFGQKVEAGRGFLERFSSGVSTVATAAQLFGQKVSSSEKALEGFLTKMNKSNAEANKNTGSLKNLEGGVQSLASRFTALGQIAQGALMNIGARAQEAGMRLVNSFTFGPLMDGFREYETNMNSIQTILANTQAAGTTLKDVTGALDELNHYSDQTIYNFSEMAKNIGTFTAAGVGLKESTAAIKGIANLAAISGSNSEQAAGAMYQLSQALSAGRVTLEDWNSVVNAGMGGTVFQRALAQNAVKMGTLSESAVKLKGDMKNVTIEGKSFRESITAEPGKESWLTSGVLTQTLAQFTGDLTDAELAAQGFSKAQIKAIQDQAKMAKAAATEVKTATQLFGTFKEQLGSGWARTWQIIFGDFAEAKGLFTGVSNSIGGLLQRSSDARNKMLTEWDKFGGRTALIDGITNSMKALGSVFTPIKDAFREIFPATTGKQLADMTKSFRDFTERLIVGSATADKLKRTFAGVFAIFGIAVDIIKGVVGVIFELFGVVTQGSGGFLNFTAKIGDFLVAVRNGIREGEGLKNLFKGIGVVLAIPIKLVQELAKWLGSLFKDTDSKGVEKSVEGISSKLEPLGRLGEVASMAWEKTLTVMENVGDFFQKLGGRISDFFSGLGIDVSTMFDGLNFDNVLAGINTGLFAGLVMIIKNFAGGGAPGLLDGISEAIENFTGVLGSMQNTLRAATLLQIAVAVGILALAMNTLSKIDAEGLTRASVAMGGLFTQLLGSLLIFEKLSGFQGFAKMPFVAASMILLSVAILILAQAVEDLAALDWNELAKGLTGTVVLLGALVGVSQLMKNPKGLISTGLGMIVLAGAIKILASAVEDLSSLGWNELAKGLVGVGALLGALTLFTMFAKANKGGLAQAAGIVLLAAGIKILASAVEDFSKMSWGEIGKGLAALAGGLVIISGALKLIPPTAPLAGAGILLVALSLGKVADALEDMAKMSWGEIGKSLTVMLGALGLMAAALYVIPPTAPLGAAAMMITALALQQVTGVLVKMSEFSWEEIGKAMVVLAGTLGLIAGALLLMPGALPGAAALLVVSAALWVLHPVLVAFSEMTWEEIGKGLVMLAGALVVIGLAGLILAPVVPAIIGLGAGVALLGVGMLAAGAGVLLFATALTALAAAGSAATAMIIGIVAGLIGLIPEVMKQIGLGLVAFAEVIATAGPAITKALVTVLESLISAIVRVTPKIVDALLRMLTMLLQKLAQYVPKMVDAGLKLLTGFLRGIANNIGKVIDEATRVAVNFLNGIAKNLPKIIQSGFNLIIKFIQGVRKAIDSNAETLGREGGKMAVAIVKGMVKGIMAGLGEIKNAAMNVAKSALDSAKNFLGIHSPSKEFEKVGNYVNDGFRKGLDGNKQQIYDAFNGLKKMLLDLSKSSKASASERKKAAAAYSTLTKSLNDEKSTLGKLADKYDALTEKIKKADEAYKAAIKTRDDYRKQITDKYSDVASPTAETTYSSYVEELKKQIEDTKLFSNALQKLRGFGLNDELYKDLLEQGPSALPFVNELLDKGIEGVNEVNKLGKDLDAAGAHIGKLGSDALYQAGVDSAKGLLEGLKSQQSRLEKQMDTIAAAMINAIKKKLKIKSPSRVFMEMGGYSAQGLVKGLDEMSGSVERSAARTGAAAVESLRKSLSGFSDLIAHDRDLQPVITPVLDLSGVRKDAAGIGGLLGSNYLDTGSAYAKAKYVAAGIASNRAALEGDIPVGGSVSYVQNNYSPKALSSAEIYRNTKNQLSTVKGALATSANTGGSP
ncbi:tape measure protein [Streptomyces phage FrodoSwaggins]|uniref:Tape measure protein n=2 Tax=Rimavirus drgrey TaxID=2560783 RepID=A0A649VY79_9CAUD|nr:tape measure protein [Streptomyces phage Popy]QGJ96563.1 tape measure protein [Streptomyces phage FrodoSwaggins]